MLNKNELMKRAEDYNKNRTRTTQKTEVTVRMNKSGIKTDGAQRYNVAIRFYQNSEKRITVDGQYICYVPVPEYKRIYFFEGDAINGYKLSPAKSGLCMNTTFAPKDGDEKMWTEAIGDYYLTYDREIEWYYIDLAKKKK